MVLVAQWGPGPKQIDKKGLHKLMFGMSPTDTAAEERYKSDIGGSQNRWSKSDI